ncbi:MFS transporter, partial [Jatrophihabitans endophyticus]|uniref:MFS transporter n=1 Tax=Jatrophihabitans endophyticus TaxID=1206085 RepID=UPI001A0B95BA
MRPAAQNVANRENAAGGFAGVFRVPAFRVLFGAELQSVVGDQLARIALSVLVFSRTGSDSATALTYGLTYLPAVLGGFVLARLGDRWPRRRVMIGCDVLRAAVFAAMALPGLSLPVVGALLVVAVFVGPAFSASAVSLLAATLDEAQFRSASGLRMTSNQLAQVAGFAAGGALTAALGARGTLVLDAATYLVSAAVVTIGLRTSSTRPESSSHRPVPTAIRNNAQLLRAVLRDPRARTMLLLSLLAGVFIAPEGLAVPFAAQVGGSTTEAGLLLASIPLGSAAGVLLVVGVVPSSQRHRLATLMAMTTGVPLAFTAVHPALAVAGILWFLSGLAAAYQVEALVTLVRWAPDDVRARLVSVCSSLLLGVQGI